MSATNNSRADAESTAPAQNGSIIFLAIVFAFVRTMLLIVAAVSLGASARYFFPEMFVITGSPVVLLIVVAVDTFAVAMAVLKIRARHKKGR